jgi:hypothetical protein
MPGQQAPIHVQHAPPAESPWATSRPGSRMNPRRVIVWMTVGIFIVLTVLSTLFFHGIPPWPVLVVFAISHGGFCFIISRVKPYKGPYTQPMTDGLGEE